MAVGIAGVIAFRDAGNSYAQSIYSALQLFTLDDGSSGNKPASGTLFEIARFGAAAVSLSAILAIVATLAADARSVVRARLARGHIVVCGLDVHGRRIVSNLIDRRQKVVGIEANPEALGIREARERGAAVLVGDATDPQVLNMARIGRAKKVVVVTGDHGVNSQVVSAISEAKSRNSRWKSNTVRVEARAGSAGMERELTSRNIVPDSERVSVEWFHDERISAKAMLSDHVQLLRQAASQNPPEGFVIVGSGLTARDLLLDAARQWSSLRRVEGNQTDRLPVTVIARHVDEWMRVNRRVLYHLDDALEVAEIDFTSPEEIHIDSNSPTVFICESSTAEAMKTAAVVEAANPLPGRSWMIPVVGDLTGFEKTLSRPDQDGEVRFIDILELTCGAAIMEHTLREQLARDNHHIYQRMIPGLPASKPWEDLDEDQRQDNRDAAMHHLEVKIPAAGLRLEPATNEGAKPFEFTDETLEELSKLEHERWHQSKLRDGWEYDPKLGDGKQIREQKKHGDMKPWDELSEATKEKDRMFVRALPEMLMAGGFELKPQC